MVLFHGVEAALQFLPGLGDGLAFIGEVLFGLLGRGKAVLQFRFGALNFFGEGLLPAGEVFLVVPEGGLGVFELLARGAGFGFAALQVLILLVERFGAGSQIAGVGGGGFLIGDGLAVRVGELAA